LHTFFKARAGRKQLQRSKQLALRKGQVLHTTPHAIDATRG